MCYDEFNRLFCRGMFKAALINTLNSLNKPQSNFGKSGNWSNLVKDLNFNQSENAEH